MAFADAADVEVNDRIERVEIRGNRRIETDAVRVQLGSKAGQPLDPAQVRADIRALWKLGVFSNVAVFTEPAPSGAPVLVVELEERPSIRKVLVAGYHEVKLDKLNDVLDLERDSVVDIAAIRRNRDKLAELYTQQGFYLSTVDFDLVPVSASEVDVRFTVDEHAKVKVGDITFVGNHAVSTSDLRDAIATRKPNALSFMNDSGVYRQDILERDLVMLSALYLDRGYAQVKIAAPTLRLSRDGRRMYVTISIDEGPRFAFGSITVKGDLIGTPADQQRFVKARPGDTFSRTQAERDRKALEMYYQDQGYAYANVTPRMRVDLPNRRIETVYEIARGKRVYVERIAIRGNSKTRDKVIRREMKITEGELFSSTAVEASRRRIMVLGFFESATIGIARGSSDEFVVLNVEVIERRTGSFQVGAGFSSQEAFLLQGQIAHDNFLGRGHSLSAQAMFSRTRRQFGFRFVEPSFLDTDWMFSTELYNQSRGFGKFSRNATGGALTWGYQLTDHARASLTYRLEHVDISSGTGSFANFGARTEALPTLDTANLFRGGWTSSVRGSFGWDSRDNRFAAASGWHANVFAEYAGRETGSENQFVRWGGFVRHYRRLADSPFVLRLNGELGVTTSLDGKGVPLSERYLLGGIFDVRGYTARSLGPQLYVQNASDVGARLDPLPLGGNLQLIGNAEIEFPLVKKLGLSGVVFFDIGNAYNLERRYCSHAGASSTSTPSTVDPCVSPAGMLGGLRKSIGAGIRWNSPMGPLRFEWGLPLDLGPNEKPSGLDFTIGTSF
ncbi:MAG TPA: outer membrane protein assembly factor BamA [Kofleriaceae bacterium]|nr:outer membrane protein assembly factor BamA [Kofleriaceae bacterium]